jgi:putative transposase
VAGAGIATRVAALLALRIPQPIRLGIEHVRLIISDACIGLAESAAEFFPEAARQRCVVHWYRNIFSHVPSTKVREIAAMLKAIHASEDIAAAREKPPE